ncbi:LLM class flavin-dependent oxidoreductase [Actinacidiphila oryziradicis]|uniref:LLM class flavin-dependent oxidoreductase n=1 Tax=Actinacidiphila oryziradicis TaxID=2571141 RepID=A0A4U0S6N5_9ACTN|nr:LLM class flavin-dependent oxidoreductase [Actinacidiphila oryziradicis]TKA04780.1 LLM class flavin-dependent oxidoreductase [Actinacidiphila oryziradicis]
MNWRPNGNGEPEGATRRPRTTFGEATDDRTNSAASAGGSKERAARFGNGWLPACLTPSEISGGVAEIRAGAEQSGRALPADFDVAPQLAVALGRTREEALKTFEESQIFTHMRSLSESTLNSRQADLTERNLIGSPDDVLEQVQRYADAGATTLSALLFAANDVPQTLEQMQEFSESIIAVVNDRVEGTDQAALGRHGPRPRRV